MRETVIEVATDFISKRNKVFLNDLFTEFYYFVMMLWRGGSWSGDDRSGATPRVTLVQR